MSVPRKRASRSWHRATPPRLHAHAQGAQQFLLIQISGCDAHRLLGFPALDRVAALQQQSLQHRLGHPPCAAGDPLEGAAVVKEGSQSLPQVAPAQQALACPHPPAALFVDRGLGGRFDPPQGLRQFAPAGIAAVLPHDPAAVAHSEQHRAALSIEKGAESVAAGAQLAGGAFGSNCSDFPVEINASSSARVTAASPPALCAPAQTSTVGSG